VTDRRQVVIVGAGAAGDAAAEALRKSGFDGGVVLVGSDRHRAYHRPYLSKQFLRDELPFERVFLRRPDAYQGLGVEWLAERRVVEASRRDSSVVLDDGRSIRFDVLVLATGGSPRWLEGVPRLANVLTLRSLDDGLALKQALAASRRLLVIGAGFIGAEVAASARALGRDVLVVEVAPVPLGRALGEEMGRVYARIHRERGVDLRTATSVTRWIAHEDRVQAVELSDGSREEVDLVLVAVGIAPELTLARQLDLPLGAGGVMVDEALRAEANVYCAGDIAAHLHPVFHRHLRVEHWQVARKQGQAIGEAIAGQPRPYEELPWFWSDQYDLNLQYVGHAAAFDQVVWRGDPAGRTFSIFFLQQGLVEAVLAVNDARTIRFSRELIRRRAPVAPDALAAESTDLKELTAGT
jgi:3-phenylpropionate/trans-cinnamate dioxygenase ferredoxin reductase component